LPLPKSEVVVRTAGAAGDGIAATGESFAKVCSRSGLHVFAYNSYQSVIRGGFVWLQVRAGRTKVQSHGAGTDFLIALNSRELERHANDVVKGGGILYNKDKVKPKPGLIRDDITQYALPVLDITAKHGKNPILQNTVALGALVKILKIDFSVLSGVLSDTFGSRKKAALEANLAVSQAGYEYAETFETVDFALDLDYNTRRPIMTGNQALALGAVAAGCKFYAAYPMTPASSILHWLAATSTRTGILVKQAEDEIAVLNMAIGAAFAGVRSMVGTSGGGFSLMSEAIGLAGQTETPVVIISSQRGGPSTGLPTKTEQADLFQALGASQGDYPKIVLAPSTVDDCFSSIVEAFNLAEKFQVPVIVLSDLYLSEHMESLDGIDLDFCIERGEFAKPDVGSTDSKNGFKRYAFTESGVSPRSFPGRAGTVFQASSDEHDDAANIISDVFTDEEMRTRMFQKRMRKMERILPELTPPRLEGKQDADLTLIGWGSTYGMIKEAISTLGKEGMTLNHLHIKYMLPFHAKQVKEILESCRNTLTIESNYTGQLSRLIRMETGFDIKHQLLKYDGEPFYPGQIITKVREVNN